MRHMTSHNGTRASNMVEIVGRLLKAQEVGETLGLGRSKIYELMAEGQIPTVRIGRAVRVPERELQEWIRHKTNQK